MIIVDRDQLRKLGEQLRADGKTIVFTNDVFDILHAGHVTYLEQARALGDLLIVGSSTLGPFGRVFIGSSTNQIVRHCPVPTLITPA